MQVAPFGSAFMLLGTAIDASLRDVARPRRSQWLIAAMVLAVTLIAAIAYFDARQEASSALADFADQQSTLANGVADALEIRLGERDSIPPAAELASSLGRVERPARVALLISPPNGDFFRTDGSSLRLPVILDAIRDGVPWARLTREEAATLGLPARTAVAGIATFGHGLDERWTVVVVATAQAERDREVRAEWRLVLGVGLAAGLVMAFGGIALRKQRTELELERELAVADAQHVRDERLVRADKLATMGALATGIGHEVATPLGVILGRAEQLRSKVTADPRAERALDAIIEQGERISRVIRGFLALARGESPAFDRVEPSAIARASVELVEHRFAKANVDLRGDIARALPVIACEPRLLEQALVNLLLNACDACEPGGHVVLTVHGDTERVVFVVVDDGTGIPEESAARLGEPFFTTKPSGKGTGLGLAITNEIVKHHRGTLAIEARERASGTRARIEIPAALSDHDHLDVAV